MTRFWIFLLILVVPRSKERRKAGSKAFSGTVLPLNSIIHDEVERLLPGNGMPKNIRDWWWEGAQRILREAHECWSHCWMPWRWMEGEYFQWITLSVCKCEPNKVYVHINKDWNCKVLFLFQGYVVRISGGNDKQGFPMKQGILTTGRVRLLLSKGHSCYRPRRSGERKRKSVRGCIVDANMSVLNLVVVKKGMNYFDFVKE